LRLQLLFYKLLYVKICCLQCIRKYESREKQRIRTLWVTL